jgi:plasmid stabilization system protein ParE
MTIKDDLHALIDQIDEADAREALAFLKARQELDPAVSQAYIGDCEAAYKEAHAPEAVLVPDEAVRIWLETWGTRDEAAADREIELVEEELANKARARERPAVAARVARDVLAAVARLREYPYYGRLAQWDQTNRMRELPVPHTPLVVLYEIDVEGTVITILRVVHGAQRREFE